MLLLDGFRYLTGYVQIEITGDFAERFINLCAKHRLSVWNIKRKGDSLVLCTGIKSYKRVRALRKKVKYGIKIRIIKKIGFPFFVRRYRDRKGLLAGVACFFGILYFMSRFIWTIDVVGNDTIPTNEILSVCGELGIREGIFRTQVDAYNLPQEMILKNDGIAWCSFNVEGSKLTVDISEAKDSRGFGDAPPCNLIAGCDGVIKSAEVTVGDRLVQPGQAVRKGDLLVSGAYTIGSRSQFVESDGVILADTTRTFTVSVPLRQTVDRPSDRAENRSLLELFGLRFPLFLGNIRYEYESKYFEKNLTMFSGRLPIKLMTRQFREILHEEIVLTEEEAENEGLSQIAFQVKQLPITQASIRSVDKSSDGNTLTLTMTVSCLEDIAQKEEILINNGN